MSPTCAHCHGDGSSDRLSPYELETFYCAGEVFSIRESVFTPIEEMFTTRAVSSLTGDELQRSRVSLETLRTRNEDTLKARPGILLKEFRTPCLDRRGAIICLMATFEGTPMDDLPRVFPYFCCPVYPNDGVNSAHRHFHCLPQWDKPSTWIIAWSFRSRRSLGIRWLTPENWEKMQGKGDQGKPEDVAADRAERTGMAFGPQATMELSDYCSKLRHSWMLQCRKNRLFSLEHEREYRVGYIQLLRVL